jgi:cysteine-rich repeat protein
MRVPLEAGLKRVALIVVLAAANAFALLYVTGVAYEPFSWQAFAQVYDNLGEPPVGDPINDPDGDAIKSPQRDPDTSVFNPSGCFFNLASGAIVPGGLVSASCTGCGATEANVPNGPDPMDGSNGCFTFKYTMGPNPPSPPTGGIGAVFDFTITPPAHCVLAADCPDQGAFATSGSGVSAPDPVSIGNFPNPALTTVSAACTPWYSKVTFDTEDDSHVVSAVINNNIPLDCCGDGLISGDEACDDGNFAGGDGCAADCSIIEPGFECPTPGSPCLSICGDSLIVGGETCDDGNTDDGDCCTSQCQFDPQDCPAAPAPTLGPAAMAAAVLTLLGVVFFALRRRNGVR